MVWPASWLGLFVLREERLCSECIHGTISYIIATVTKITTEGLGETKYVIDITHKQHAPEDSFFFEVWVHLWTLNLSTDLISSISSFSCPTLKGKLPCIVNKWTLDKNLPLNRVIDNYDILEQKIAWKSEWEDLHTSHHNIILIFDRQKGSYQMSPLTVILRRLQSFHNQ